MKRPPLFLSFLSLVFSLLGATTILTIVLAMTAGRAQHSLRKDYIRVTVFWDRFAPDQDDYACSLFDGNNDRQSWTFETHPPEKEEGPEPVSIFYKAPAAALAWRVRQERSAPVAKRIIVETKRGSTEYTGFSASRELVIQTQE